MSSNASGAPAGTFKCPDCQSFRPDNAQGPYDLCMPCYQTQEAEAVNSGFAPLYTDLEKAREQFKKDDLTYAQLRQLIMASRFKRSLVGDGEEMLAGLLNPNDPKVVGEKNLVEYDENFGPRTPLADVDQTQIDQLEALDLFGLGRSEEDIHDIYVLKQGWSEDKLKASLAELLRKGLIGETVSPFHPYLTARGKDVVRAIDEVRTFAKLTPEQQEEWLKKRGGRPAGQM